MADGATVEIKGLAELAKTLEQDLPEKMSKGVIRDALEAGGDVIASAAESNTRGELQEDVVVVVRIANLSSGLAGTAFIGPGFDPSSLRIRKRGKYAGRPDPTTSPGVFGKFVELGHAPPGMAEEKRRARRRGTAIEFGDRDTPPHPWLGPAFNSEQGEALDRVVDKLREGIDAAAKEVAKK